MIEPIHEGIRESLRLGTRLYQPPNGDVTYTSAFGYSLGDLFNYGGNQLEKKMRAIGIPAPPVDLYVPPIDAPWPPPGGGLIATDRYQRVFTGALRALGRVAPRFTPGLSLMSLYLAFDRETTKGVDATYRFDLSGRGGGTFTVEVKDGDCRIRTGASKNEPDVTFEMAASTWLAMAQGLATGDEAILLGKLRLRGDVELGRRFNDFFTPQGDPPIRAASHAA